MTHVKAAPARWGGFSLYKHPTLTIFQIFPNRTTNNQPDFVMKSSVYLDDRRMPVEIVFAKKCHLEFLDHWRCSEDVEDDPHVSDSLEFCHRASKRWRYYRSLNDAAISPEQLRKKIRANPKAEIAFLLLVIAEWHEPSRILGFCFCRRTWCNHLALDFMAVHPSAAGPGERHISGVGTALISAMLRLARQLKIKTIWGEATCNSNGFYRKVFGLKGVSDYFIIKRSAMRYFLSHYKPTASRRHRKQRQQQLPLAKAA